MSDSFSNNNKFAQFHDNAESDNHHSAATRNSHSVQAQSKQLESRLILLFRQYVAAAGCYGQGPTMKMNIISILPSSIYYIIIESLVEFRDYNWIFEPYSPNSKFNPPENPPNLILPGYEPSIWSLDVSEYRPKLTSDKSKPGSQIIPVENSQRIDDCKQCEGTGKQNHALCKGKGSESCIKCTGTGSKTSKSRSSPDILPELSDRCRNCGGTGVRRCVLCEGTGKIQCKICLGGGKLLNQLNLMLKYRVFSTSHFYSEFGVTQKYIHRASTYPDRMNIILKEERKYNINEANLTDLVGVIPEKLLNELYTGITQCVLNSELAKPNNSNILSQHIFVRNMPSYSVKYTVTGKRLEYSFVAYGNNISDVYESDYPHSCGCCSCKTM